MMDEPATYEAGHDDHGSTGSTTQDPVGVETAKRSRLRRRVTLMGGLLTLIAAGVVLPPLISINQYKKQITAVMSRSLGRPVRLSGVELRLLPMPGFVLHDLAVGEDPGFGAEPILSARTVVASVRLPSLWGGRLEVSRVSADEASLNLVRSAQGRWNLESLLMGAQPGLTGRSAAGGATREAPVHFPHLEATNSRVNLKNGVEKSSFSIVNTDLSFWQDEPGHWRVQLKGQPVRTDMEMSSADAGEVRLEARVQNAAQLRDMPVNIQMEWRDAQLGQLSRLMLGSDAGWRGDLTADISVQGTADNAQTKARLRATGVRRAEFAPETTLDFDTNCGFRYQHSQNAFHDLDCNTAVGGGRLHLKAELPGNSTAPKAMLEVQQIPVQAGFDLLRTVRSGFAPGISVRGNINGSLTYEMPVAGDETRGTKKQAHHSGQKLSAKAKEAELSYLHGTLVVDGAQLNGGGLKEPLTLPRMTWSPITLPGSGPGDRTGSRGLEARFTVALAPATAQPANAAAASAAKVASDSAHAIAVQLSLSQQGFEAAVNGSGSVNRLRELAYAFGLPRLDAADSFVAGTADFNFTSAGPWIPSSDLSAAQETTPPPPRPGEAKPERLQRARSAEVVEMLPTSPTGVESLSGLADLRHAQWKSAFLAQPVDLPQATVTFSGANIAFASQFSYGGQKDAGKEHGESLIQGSVEVKASANCKAAECQPQVELRFGALDADAAQAALLGASEEKGLLEPLMDRLRSSERPKWPEIMVHMQAESLKLGPATVEKPALKMHVKENGAAIEEWTAELMGGSAKGSGHFAWTGEKPEYSFDGTFERLNATSVGGLLGAKWSGGPISGSGSVQLSGLTEKELAASASGNMQFDWRHGAIALGGTGTAPEEERFDHWSGAVSIQGGKAQVGENAMVTGRRSLTVAGLIPFGGPAKLAVTPSNGKLMAHAARPPALPTVR